MVVLLWNWENRKYFSITRSGFPGHGDFDRGTIRCWKRHKSDGSVAEEMSKAEVREGEERTAQLAEQMEIAPSRLLRCN